MCSSLRYNCPFARNLPPSIGPEPPIQYVAIIKTNVGVFMSFCSPGEQFQAIRQVFQPLCKRPAFFSKSLRPLKPKYRQPPPHTGEFAEKSQN